MGVMVRCQHTCGQNENLHFLLKHLVLLLFDRYWRRRLGLQVDYAESNGYRFCYTHRGKPGSRPSVLMLHGFSAHKDMWLGVVKVPASSHPTYIINFLHKQACLSFTVLNSTQMTHFQICSSFQPMCIWCVLTCLAMKVRHALVQWTTPLRVRSKGYIRYCLLSLLNVHVLLISCFGS